MVVKSATKKKLMDLGIDENFAHALADDRKWDDVKVMSQADIAKICETDSETAGNIHSTILAATQKGRDGDGESTGPVTKVRLSGRSSKRRTAPRPSWTWNLTITTVRCRPWKMNWPTTPFTRNWKKPLKPPAPVDSPTVSWRT